MPLEELLNLNPSILIFPTLVIAAITLFIKLGVKIVPQGQEWTLERFGRFQRVLPPGLHLITPLLENIGAKISLREQVLDIPAQDVISQDNAMVRVDGVVFFRVFDSQKAAYKVEKLKYSIVQLTMTSIRTVMGELKLDGMLSNRDIINRKLLKVIDEATDDWGVKVMRVEIKDIHPPRDLQEAMSRQMKAERERRALVLEAEGIREAMVLKSNGKKESAILEAEGEQKATILQAQAAKECAFLKAEARERAAEVESTAISVVAAAIEKKGAHASKYFLTKAYIKALDKMGSAENSKTIFMPIEASQLVSSLGTMLVGAKDIAQKPTAKQAKEE